MAKRRYQISDGKLVLTLEPDEDGWFVVTSPTDPAMITQARSIDEAFAMARDAFAALADSRSDTDRWSAKVARRPRRSTHQPVGAGI
jgi:predicted RNase H-like HicB family nuclease